jgi:hypothetical protein
MWFSLSHSINPGQQPIETKTEILPLAVSRRQRTQEFWVLTLFITQWIFLLRKRKEGRSLICFTKGLTVVCHHGMWAQTILPVSLIQGHSLRNHPPQILCVDFTKKVSPSEWTTILKQPARNVWEKLYHLVWGSFKQNWNSQLLLFGMKITAENIFCAWSTWLSPHMHFLCFLAPSSPFPTF